MTKESLLLKICSLQERLIACLMDKAKPSNKPLDLPCDRLHKVSAEFDDEMGMWIA